MRFAQHFRMGRAADGFCSLLAIPALVPVLLNSAAYSPASLTVRVSNGGNYSAAAVRVILTDTNSRFPTACSTIGPTPGSQTTGAIVNGSHSGAAPVKVGKAASLMLHNCSPGPLGSSVAIRSKKLPYNINVDSATNSNGETDVIISGIDFSWSSAGCAFSITGSAPGYYRNSAHRLSLTPALPVKPLKKAQLTISNVSGCAGTYMNGDHMSMKGAYPLSIPVKISSA